MRIQTGAGRDRRPRLRRSVPRALRSRRDARLRHVRRHRSSRVRAAESPASSTASSLDGTDITPRMTQLITDGKAKRTTTPFRTLVEVAVADLAAERMDSSELELRAGALAARMQLRRNAPACKFEGDPNGVKVLVTGFQPFPADGWHENVSGVAVTSLDPSHLRGAQVMRVVMPVEYDRAAAEVTEIIARCHPHAVISFGQGGDSNRARASRVQPAGHRRGRRRRARQPRHHSRGGRRSIRAAPATRDTLLPLDAIRDRARSRSARRRSRARTRAATSATT